MPPVLEEVIVYGRRFQLTIDGPDSLRRFSAIMTDAVTGRMLTRTPVRGRSAADARDRALEVLHNLVGIERFYEQVRAVAAQLAPGAVVDLTEDAHAIHADVSGAWELGVSFTVARDDVTDPEADPQVLRGRIEEHFRKHLRQVG